jgi:Fe-S cluster assembly protein SufD
VHVALPGASDAGLSNVSTTVDIGDDASLTHVKLVAERDQGVHLATLRARLGAHAIYRPFQMSIGGRITRNDIEVAYGGEGGNLDLSGAFLGRGETHIDTTLVVDHAVPRCQSRELFKGVLDGHAKGVFQGKIIVRPNAQKTDGKQMAQALMLSPDAEFDSKPELEIYADDVVCGHGSTAAEIDEDLLFYCRSRGIPLETARALLVESFIGEAIERIEHEAIRSALAERALGWLGSAGT